MKYLVLVLLVVVLGGCASNSQVFMDNAGNLKRCSSYGAGLMGVSAASKIFESCVRDYKAVGMLEIERVGATGFRVMDIEGGGLRVVQVVKNSPAETSGVKIGDLLHKINGQKITKYPEMASMIFMPVGSDIEFTFKREDREITHKLIMASYSDLYGTK